MRGFERNIKYGLEFKTNSYKMEKTVQNIVEINFFEPFCHKYAHDEK